MIGDRLKEFALSISYNSYLDVEQTMKNLTSDITIYCIKNNIEIEIN
jgi:hypothetical protein